MSDAIELNSNSSINEPAQIESRDEYLYDLDDFNIEGVGGTDIGFYQIDES